MRRVTDTQRLELTLVAALVLVAVFAATVGTPASRAFAAPAPRVTLSIPSEVDQASPATAIGKVVPSQRGRIVLQAWRADAWRAGAAGKVRHGMFRISFVLDRATASRQRMRAVLVRGGLTLAISAVRKVRVRAAGAVPGPSPATPSPPSTAPNPVVVSGSPPPTAEGPPAGGEEEPPSPPPAPNAYWGAWIGSQLTGEAAPWDMSAVTEFEQLTGKPLSLIEFSSPFADCTASPCSYYDFPGSEFSAIRAHGAIPFFSWGSKSLAGSPTQPEFQLADVIAGTYDSYISTWATHAAEWGHPFFLRFDWEMNGNWFPWGEGVNGNQPGEFVAAWRHVHDIFASVGATNATWVWCPYVNRLNHYAGLYPGDAYVDWTCLDGYNWGTNPAAPYGWSTFDALYGTAYDKVTEEVAPAKPMVVGETAASEYGGSKAGWIEKMFEALETSYPQIRGLVWFEKVDNGMDWPLESSESAEDAFAAGISASRFLGNVFGALGAGPVPAP